MSIAEPDHRPGRTTEQAAVAFAEAAATIRAGFEDWNDARIEALAERYAEDAEVDLSAVMADVGPVRGRLRLRYFWATLRENWVGLRVDVIDVFDVGDRRFVSDCRLLSLEPGPESVAQQLAHLFTFDADGKILRCQVVPDVEAAIELAADEPV